MRETLPVGTGTVKSDGFAGGEVTARAQAHLDREGAQKVWAAAQASPFSSVRFLGLCAHPTKGDSAVTPE